MGIIDTIACLTTDPAATTYYALSRDVTYNNTAPIQIILLKSNSNPTSPSSLTWSVVSRIDQSPLVDSSADVFTTYSCTCAVDAQGVFTLFGSPKGASNSLPPNIPVGIRYDPASTTDPKYNYKGPGGWMNIIIDPKYNWGYKYDLQALGYVNSGGSKLLVHCVMNSGSGAVTIATMNESTKTLTAAAVWNLPPNDGIAPKVFFIGNDQLFMFTVEHITVSLSTLNSFPLSTITNTQPAVKSYNTSVITDCHYSPSPYLYTIGDRLMIYCDQLTSFTSKIYSITDLNTTVAFGPPEEYSIDITMLQFFVPIGEVDGPSSFVLGQKYNFQLYAFGKNIDGSRYFVPVANINVTDPVGSKPSPTTSHPSPFSDTTHSNIGTIVGIVVAVLVVFMILVYLIKKKTMKKEMVKKAEADVIVVRPPPLAQDPVDLNGYDLKGQCQKTTYPSGQPVPLPIAPVVPHPQQHNQGMQEQMQSLQFSNHPHPIHVLIIDPSNSGLPMPSSPSPMSPPPSILHDTRPGPDIGSPQSISSMNNQKYVTEYHVN
ncbi:hypothetical protein FBU30_009667 [Linnemannia zychae]|nr:hypothetical protein FBU30_009667 [Linnemannia zychae]